jgi:hypothetical protein
MIGKTLAQIQQDVAQATNCYAAIFGVELPKERLKATVEVVLDKHRQQFLDGRFGDYTPADCMALLSMLEAPKPNAQKRGKLP